VEKVPTKLHFYHTPDMIMLMTVIVMA